MQGGSRPKVKKNVADLHFAMVTLSSNRTESFAMGSALGGHGGAVPITRGAL
jgi:hypothetical protein